MLIRFLFIFFFMFHLPIQAQTFGAAEGNFSNPGASRKKDNYKSAQDMQSFLSYSFVQAKEDLDKTQAQYTLDTVQIQTIKYLQKSVASANTKNMDLRMIENKLGQQPPPLVYLLMAKAILLKEPNDVIQSQSYLKQMLQLDAQGISVSKQSFTQAQNFLTKKKYLQTYLESVAKSLVIVALAVILFSFLFLQFIKNKS